jgi:hypothetical protein
LRLFLSYFTGWGNLNCMTRAIIPKRMGMQGMWAIGTPLG